MEYYAIYALFKLYLYMYIYGYKPMRDCLWKGRSVRQK